MLAEVPGWVTDGAVFFGALLTFTTFVGVVAKSPVGRWVGRQVGEDARGWVETIAERSADRALERYRGDLDDEVEQRLDDLLPKHLKPVLYELRTNGGGSFRDDTVRELREIKRQLDRFATFMDESTMDRRDLRRMFEDEIARTNAAERGEIDDREEPDPTEGP